MFPGYMKLYNFTGLVICITAIVFTILHAKLHLHSYVLKLAFCQTFFLLELFNIRIGQSNSTMLPTILQLSLRLFIIWVICYLLKGVCDTLPFTVMSTSWFLSDTIRYLFYLLKSDWARWARYNFFIVFYPIGTSMEIYLMNLIYHKHGVWVGYVVSGIMLCYIPGFLFLYYHMIKQRIAGKKRRSKGRKINERKVD